MKVNESLNMKKGDFLGVEAWASTPLSNMG
jgi:hypothetical protein